MLSQLRIQQFAIIDLLELSFSDGFTVLTGETGAGKSIIIDAISLLLGRSASSEYIKSGSEWADIEGVFRVKRSPKLALFLDDEDDTTPLVDLIVRRKLTRTQQNMVRVNGHAVTVKQLRTVMEDVIQIVGQHEFMRLFKPEDQLEMIDVLGGSPLLAAKTRYQEVHSAYQDAVRECEALSLDETELSQKKSFLAFQIQDIESQAFQKNEDEQLRRQRDQSRHAHHIRQAVETAQQALQEITSAFHVVEQAFQTVQGVDSTFQLALEKVVPARLEAEDQVAFLQKKQHELGEASDYDLNEIEARLDVIFKFKQKYHVGSVNALLALVLELKQKLEALESANGRAAELSAKMTALRTKLQGVSRALSVLRQDVVRALNNDMKKTLCQLQLGHAIFEAQVQFELDRLANSGGDTINLLVSTNSGEALKPLHKVASGGELSRLMLALKIITQEWRPVSCLIFDEVDVGVGGETASKIGDYLKTLSDRVADVPGRCQVFCVTHLPQIARVADTHFYVDKQILDGRTLTRVSQLNDDARRREIERMIGGKAVLEMIQTA